MINIFMYIYKRVLLLLLLQSQFFFLIDLNIVGLVHRLIKIMTNNNT